MINEDLYFVLTSECKLVKGVKRCVIIDYGRSELYFISHPYLELLERMDRTTIKVIKQELSDSSMPFFYEFLSFLIKQEIGFLTDIPECFPKISEEDTVNEYVDVIDVIIEVDPLHFEKELFQTLCNELSTLNCKEFQVRYLSGFDLNFLTEITRIIGATNASYLEIHCDYTDNFNTDEVFHLIEANAVLNSVCVYSAPANKVSEVVKETGRNNPIVLGTIHFITYAFDGGNCCGIINQESLIYTSAYLHNQLKNRNGCLDRKISVDRFGNIRNCPSMKTTYGNIRTVSIKEVLKNKEFQQYWYIHKDQISICKVCEFRYNCTDCRGFIQDPNDIYSKPLKCGYNPYTCEWEDWSENTLKGKGTTAVNY